MSNAITQCVGFHSRIALKKTLVNPYTPVTSSPVEDTVRCLCTDIARNDLCIIAWPSIIIRTCFSVSLNSGNVLGLSGMLHLSIC